MAEEIVPFSARNRGAYAQIDNDCPETVRMGLLHLLVDLVEKNYVEGWKEVVGELQRIDRSFPAFDSKTPRGTTQGLLLGLAWEKVFDFCQRLHNHLAREVSFYDSFDQAVHVQTPRSQVQEYIASALQLLFMEEHLAFEFSNGRVRRRGRRHTADQVVRAELVLGDPRLASARGHFNKALKYFRNVAEPDYENAVKEAVCAVEATARVLFPDGGATLGDIVKSITGSEVGQLPKMIAKTFDGLWGFRSGGEGVGHGGATGGKPTKELAEYALALAASQIVLLVNLDMTLEPDVPF